MFLRYEVGGKRYPQIVNFTRHQNPHKDERQSTIPPPDGLSDPSGPADHDEHHASMCKHRASTMQKHCANRLIPDSLIPDSRILNPESNTWRSRQVPRWTRDPKSRRLAPLCV